jgi:hypothetical protein
MFSFDFKFYLRHAENIAIPKPKDNSIKVKP